VYDKLTMIAGWQRTDLRDMMYSGMVKAARRQPMFRGKITVGYKRVAIAVHGDGGTSTNGTRTTLVKG
jgi:hypothetical protein